ncbi:membrane-associated, eicosanoid/glutathione metabolism protein [Xylariaceae sp. FL1651]|nr:membrane-associated, eicosanoid/glutathione metabolism protein [Xylariaceae sp. FL1651]
MSTQIGLLAAPVLPPLLPVTGSFALPFTAYFSWLSLRVVRYRIKDNQLVGDNSSKEVSEEARLQNKLYLASRCHQNFVENVPFAFVLAALAELNGGDRKTLTGLMSALFVFRVLHGDFGLNKGLCSGRPIGYFGTLATIGSLAGYAAYLVKGYWGF